MSTVFQPCIADTRSHSPSIAEVKQSLPASSSLKASQSSALNSSMACRKVISSTWPPASRSISPLLLALTCAGLKEVIFTVPSKVEIKSGSSLIGQAVNSEQWPSTIHKGVSESLDVNNRYTANRNTGRAEYRRILELQPASTGQHGTGSTEDEIHDRPSDRPVQQAVLIIFRLCKTNGVYNDDSCSHGRTYDQHVTATLLMPHQSVHCSQASSTSLQADV